VPDAQSEAGLAHKSDGQARHVAISHGLPPELFARMKQAVIELFADTERKGELD